MDDRVYLFDAGADVLRGARAAGLASDSIEHVFLTHLHSDHTLGLDEMIVGAWTTGRRVALQIHGPPGTQAMVDHLIAAFEEDRLVRSSGLEGADPQGALVQVREREPGDAYQDEGIRVVPFSVEHGSWERAYGYRVEGPDRTVVISGDTAPTDAIVEACDGCDVLVHEVYSTAGWREGPADFRAYHAAFHTSGERLGRIASRARPRLLILDHLLFFGHAPGELLSEVRGSFDGEVVIAEDGEVY